MKRLAIYLLLSMFWITGAVHASTWKINDGYIGGKYDDSNYVKKEGDVIAINTREFDIDWMNVTIKTNGDVKVRIKTRYEDGTRDTTYGDLFVSTDGWNPKVDLNSWDSEDTYERYRSDTYETGERWEYALSTSSGKIYSVDADNIWRSDQEFSDPYYQDHWYRHEQEVLYKPGDEEASVGDFAFSHSGNLIKYAFNLSTLLGEDWSWEDELDLGFHWAMTCANDVIEGGIYKAAAVPEPGTMLLLGMGIAGLGAAGKKRFRKQ
jgi:hypothetical protein